MGPKAAPANLHAHPLRAPGGLGSLHPVLSASHAAQPTAEVSNSLILKSTSIFQLSST